MQPFLVNNLIRLSVLFTAQASGDPIDPEVVTLYVRNPDYTVDEFTYADAQLIRTGVGAYYYDLENTQSGYYNFEFEGTGNVQVSQAGQFQSIPSFLT